MIREYIRLVSRISDWARFSPFSSRGWEKGEAKTKPRVGGGKSKKCLILCGCVHVKYCAGSLVGSLFFVNTTRRFSYHHQVGM